MFTLLYEVHTRIERFRNSIESNRMKSNYTISFESLL
jgi:hypothetical protein